jgi:hypothetical protein
MDAALKHKMVEKIMTSEDEMLLEEVKQLLGLAEGDFWNDLPESTKQSIQRGLEQSKRGETIPHEKVMTDIKARFLKHEG